MKIKRFSLGVFIAIFFIACGTNDENNDYKLINIASHKGVGNPLFSFGETTCLKVKDINESIYSVNCDTINNFDYEWGYTYELKVKETKLSPPPQDTSDTRIDLVSIESKTEVAINTTFSYAIYLNNYTIELMDSKYYFYNKEFTCAENIECSNLLDLVGERYILIFEHLGNSKIKLISFQEDMPVPPN